VAWDVGAVSPAGWAEAQLVVEVATAAVAAALALKRPAALLAAGSYAARGKAAAAMNCDLVVQLHADASAAETGPDIARVFYWPGNRDGQRAAENIARQLTAVLPWAVKVVEAGEEWPNARWCLGQVAATSVLVELGFTDGLRGRDELPRLAAAVGAALGRFST
jgi:N-acetylmuramoyl-L-alanine amidase